MESSVASPTVDVAQARELSHRWLDAWNRHDADALAELVTEDVVYDDPAWPETLHGREGVRTFAEFCWRAMPDMSYTEPMGMFVAVDGPRVVVPWHMSATFTGPLDPPGYAPTGDRVELDGLDIWDLRDGLVAHYRAYYDSMNIARQIGMMPEPGSRLEKASAAMQRLLAKRRRRR
jgi:steroid delta-isomerase-like uncharacterized protein